SGRQGDLDGARRGGGKVDARQSAHSRVPPTVILPTRTCPGPVPTGTCCPPLPQIPVLTKKSFPTASIAARASRQLPISVAPEHGAVTLPSSIRYPSETPKTKSPVAGSTCPPPKDTA